MPPTACPEPRPRRTRPARGRDGDAGRRSLLAVVGLSGCGHDTAQAPTVPTVDWRPRLVVTAAAGGLRAEVAPRGEGDPAVGADPAKVPTGSVLEVRAGDASTHRVVGTFLPAGQEGEGDPYLDTGDLTAGHPVTVVVPSPGALTLTDRDVPGSSLTVTVADRPSG